MGKKGKKSAGSSGGKTSAKKKGGKKKKNAEPQMTFKEAILAYQINIKEKAMEDFMYEIRQLEEKNNRHRERNERLKEEQLYHIDELLKAAKAFEKQLEDADVVNKEEVVAVMMEKWATARSEEQSLEEMKDKINTLETDIVQFTGEVAYWTEYRERGGDEHKTQIKLLEQELVDMQASFDEMRGHLERALDSAKSKIQTSEDTTLDKQKFIATEKALTKMDKYSRQEVLDNDWLAKEVELHKEEVVELKTTVEELERINLEIMSELFECKVEDLKISRNFYLTQFNDNENLEESGILEMDLAKLAITDRSDSEMAEEKSAGMERPQSAMQRAVEDKVFALVPVQDEETAEGSDSDYDGASADKGSDEGDPFDNYFHFEDEDFDDFLQLGPLELKLLNVAGTKMPIHHPERPSTQELEAKEYKPDQWPVTAPMLQEAVKQ